MASFFSFLAPAPAETDEELITRRISELKNGKDVEGAIHDIESLSQEYPAMIGVSGTSALLKVLGTHKRNSDVIYTDLEILKDLIGSDSLDSHSNAGYMVEDENLGNIFECLGYGENRVRSRALVVFSHLVRLQLEKVQTAVFASNVAQENLCRLVEDKVEQIRIQFFNLLPRLLHGNEDMKQAFGFQLMDPIVNEIEKTGSSELIESMNVLLEGGSKMQKLFVETGHLTKFVPVLTKGDAKAINLMIMLFSSSEAASFQKSIPSSVMSLVIRKAMEEKEKNRSMFWRLLGLFVRGNVELCTSTSQYLDRIIPAIMLADETDMESGIFFFECFSIKGAHILSEALCQNMKEFTTGALESWDSSPDHLMTILAIAKFCLIADHSCMSMYLGEVLGEKDFFSHVAGIITKISESEKLQSSKKSLLLSAAMQFVATGIWESAVAAEKFIGSVADVQVKGQSALVFLLELCMKETQEPLRSISCMTVLESLLFKTNNATFAQLIASVKRLGISEIISTADAYAKSFSDITIWSEFVQECVRVIKKNSDALLVDNVVVKSESGQLSLLQAKMEEITREKDEAVQSKEKLLQEIKERDDLIAKLEDQVNERSSALGIWEQQFDALQANLDASNEECARLQQEVDLLRTGGAVPVSSDSSEEYEKKLNEAKRELETEIATLKKENDELKKTVANLQTSDALNILTRENNDLKKKLEMAEEKIRELDEMTNDYMMMKEEMAKMLAGGALGSDGADSELVKALTEENARLKKEVEDHTIDMEVLMQENEADMEKLRNEKDNLENELMQLADENEELKSQIASAQETNNDVDEEIMRLREEIVELKSGVNTGVESEEQVAELMARIDVKKEKIKKLKQEIAATEEQNRKIESENASLLNSVDENMKLIQSHQENIAQLEKNIEEKETEIGQLRETLSVFEAQSKASESESSELTSKFMEQTEKVSTLTKLVKDLENKLAEEESKVEEMKKSLDEITNEYESEVLKSEELSQKLQEQEEKASELTAKNEETLTDFQKKLTDLETELENVRKQLTDKASECAKLSAEKDEVVRAASDKESELKATVQEKQTSIEELNDQLKLANEKTERLSKELNEKSNEREKLMTSQIEQLERDLAERSSQVNNLSKQLESSQKAEKDKEHECNKAIESAEGFKVKAEELSKQVEAKAEELSAAKEREHTLEEELEKQKGDMEELSRKLDEQEKEAEELQQKLNKAESEVGDLSEKLQSRQADATQSESELKKQIEELSEKIREHEEEATNAKNLEKQLKEELNEKEEEIQEISKKLQEQENAMVSVERVLKEKLEDAENQITDLSMQLDLADKSKDDEEKINGLMMKLKEQEATAAATEQELRQKLEEQEATEQELKKKLEEQEATASATEQELRQKLEEQEATEQELKRKLEEQEEQNATIERDLKVKLEEAENKADDISKKLTIEAEESENELRKKVEELSQELTEKNNEAQTNEEKINELLKKLEQQEQHAIAVEHELREKLDEQKELVNKAQETETSLKQELDAYHAKVEDMSKQLSDNNSFAEKLAEKEREYTEMEQNLKNKIEDDEKRIEELLKQLDTQEKSAAETEEQLKKQNADKEAENNATIRNLNAQIQELASKLSEIESLKDSEENLRAKLSSTEKQLIVFQKDSGNEIQDLKARLETAIEEKTLLEKSSDANELKLASARDETIKLRSELDILKETTRTQQSDHAKEMETLKIKHKKLKKKFIALSEKAQNTKLELAKLRDDDGQRQQIQQHLHEMKREVEKVRGKVTISSPDSEIELLHTLKCHLSSIVADLDILRQQSDVQETEIKQLKLQNAKSQDKIAHFKRTADEAVKMADGMRLDCERMNISSVECNDRIAELEDECKIMMEGKAALEKKHQAALKLIGELWTRNQSLVRRPPK